MFEQETETIISTIRKRTIGTGDCIAVKDILASDIPYPVKTFFRADTEALLLRELQAFHSSSRFTFDHPEVQSLQKQMSSVLVLNFVYKEKEFLERLNDAVHMIINYLIRPQWTLASVLFEHDDKISSPALIGLLRHFGPYEYLKDILLQYIREKPVASFTKEEFRTLLWKIDGEYVRRKSGDELARIMIPMYDFLDFPQNMHTVALPIKALRKYFEDKGLPSAMAQLEGELVQGKVTLSHAELSDLLEGVRRTSGAFIVEKIEVEQTELISSSQVATPQEEVKTSLSLDSLIEEDDRRRFIKKLFKQDENAYQSALQSMGRFPLWKNASKFIDEVFIENDIDPYSTEAKRFIEIIFRQYHPSR